MSDDKTRDAAEMAEYLAERYVDGLSDAAELADVASDGAISAADAIADDYPGDVSPDVMELLPDAVLAAVRDAARLSPVWHEWTCDEYEARVSWPENENGYSVHPDQPLAWCNHAGVEVDESENAIRLWFSVGDPRGAFQVAVRRTDDGTLLLHLPYPGMAFQHAPLTELHEGTYRIGGES